MEPTASRIARRGTTPAVWMTCVVDGQEHVIADDGMMTGVRQGQYRAVCGHRLLACPLVEPPGPRCSCCEAAVTCRRAGLDTGAWGWLTALRRWLRPG